MSYNAGVAFGSAANPVEVAYSTTQSMAKPRTKNAVIHQRVTEDTKLLLIAAADHLRNDMTGALEFVIHDFARRNRLVPADASRLTEGRTTSGASMTNETPGDYSPTDPPATKEG